MADKKTQDDEKSDNVVDLAGASAEALDGVDPEQMAIDGVQRSQVKFLGMGWDPVEVPDLRETVEIVVTGMVVQQGEEVMADGTTRDVAKVKVRGIKVVPQGTYDTFDAT